MAEKLVTRAEDYSRWYTDLCTQAQLADYSPVKGCMVIRPHGYAIWEKIQRGLDARIKATGHVNAYFPLFIPEEFLHREKEHVEGFAPQLASSRTAAARSSTRRSWYGPRPRRSSTTCTRSG